MAHLPAPTPNLRLQPIDANRRVWADIMNDNLRLIDATVGTYFAVLELQGIWENSTAYTVGQAVIDVDTSVVYQCQVAHTSANVPTTFEEDRTAHSTYWNVYSSPATARGVWLTATSYALNDFVVNGAQYAICVETHTSSASFATDLAAGKWSVLIDVSSVGTAVLPTPGGAGDGNKFATTNTGGTGYTIISATDAHIVLGAGSIGKTVYQSSDAAAIRTAINAQVAGSYVTGGPYQPLGSYQPLSSNLTTLAGVASGAFGRTALAYADVSSMKTALGGIGTAAALDVGTTASKVVQLTAAAKLPAVDGSLLTGIIPVLSTFTNSLGADVNLNNTANFFTGPTVAQGTTGTWFASGTVTMGGASLAAGDNFIVKLWDGTTVIASTKATYEGPSGTQVKSVSLSGYLASPAADIRISIKCTTNTGVQILFNTSGESKDSTLSAIRIA